MHEARFHSWHHHDTHLELEGTWVQASFHLLARGEERFWRLWVWQRLEDRTKRSWVLEGLEELPFSVVEEPGGLRLEASGIPPLRLTLDPFDFRWEGLEAYALEGGRFRELGAATLTSSNETTWRELYDGLTLGVGLSLLWKETPQRRYYGLGERTGFLDKRGRVWTNWATDNPQHHPDADPLYQVHPFVIAAEGQEAWGLYLDESWRSVFDLAASEPERSLLHTDGPTLDLYLIPGPSPKEVVRRYTALVGRPPLPPLWALGYHQCRYSYTHQAEALAVAQEFRRRGLPLDALWLDIDYMEGYKVFTFSPGRFPDPSRLVRELGELGVRTVVIVDPGVKREGGYPVYEEGHQKGYFVRNLQDQELVGEVWPKEAVWPDFTQEEVRRWWGELHRSYTDLGVAGIWNDMNEPAAFSVEGVRPPFQNRTLPPTARHGGYTHAEVHNLYGLLMSRATYEGLQRLRPERRPFVLSRSGFSGIQRYAWIWTGDNHSYWEHLEASLPMLLNLGLSGVAFAGADIGGFSAESHGELLARWTWLGVFYPFMRNHSSRASRRQEPWSFGEPWLGVIREALRFRYRLLPYLYTLAQEAASEGLPLMRPLMLEWPEDPLTWHLHDQFLLGADLLVAPALRPKETHRLVYLPEGSWREFWEGKELQGPGHVVLPTPFERIPLVQRAGSALPLTEPAPHTTDAYWEELVWQVALGEEIYGRLYEDEGEGAASGSWSELSGSYREGVLRLRWLDRGHPRQRVEALVRGVLPPREVRGSYRYVEGVLSLDLSGGEVEVIW
jgi:alpha-glucosidase